MEPRVDFNGVAKHRINSLTQILGTNTLLNHGAWTDCNIARPCDSFRLQLKACFRMII